MDHPFELCPGDRVLVIGLQDRSHLASWAQSCLLLAGIGEDEDVRAARREFVHLENAMFAAGSRDEIPWAGHQFSLIFDREGGETTLEMLRVLAPGGRVLPV